MYSLDYLLHTVLMIYHLDYFFLDGLLNLLDHQQSCQILPVTAFSGEADLEYFKMVIFVKLERGQNNGVFAIWEKYI